MSSASSGSPTLLSIPILNRGEYFREPTRGYQMEIQKRILRSMEEDETEDGPINYPMDGGDDGDDDDGDSYGYDADDEDEDKEDEEEEEHLARITIRPQTSISLPPEVEVERFLAMPTPSPSPLTSLSPPSAEEHLTRCIAPAALPLPPLPPKWQFLKL
nr:hypothetical protein [Tanacetum cinerariifolium]